MIRDRGIKKWTAFLLPEHRAGLKKLKEESLKKEKPVLDEQEWQLINEICEAMAENRALEFTYFNNGDFHTLEGHVHYMDMMNKELRIVYSLHKVYRLKMDDVINAEMK